MTLKIAALASGRGSNIASLIQQIKAKKLNASIEIVLCNNPNAPVISLATAEGIPVWVKSHKQFSNRRAFDQEMLSQIKQTKADTIVLAGYMRLLSPEFIHSFPERIVNIHPSILPAFPGAHAPSDAQISGVRLAGCTVHFVEEELDSGPIIIQAAIAIWPHETEETFMPRVHELEHKIYAQALQWLSEDRLSIQGRKVTLKSPYGKIYHPVEGALISPPLENF